MMSRETVPSSNASVHETPAAETQASALSASLRLERVIWSSLRDVWDRLGIIVAISLVLTLLAFVPLAVGRSLPAFWPAPARSLCVALLIVGTLSAPFAAACALSWSILRHDEVGAGDLWRATRQLFGPATRLGLLHLAVLSVLAVNLWFYANVRHPAGALALLLCLYALLLWGMMGIYHFPLLAAQEFGVFDEPDRKARRGALAAVRRAFFLALGAPLFSLGLLATLSILSALVWLTVVLGPLLWAGAFSLLATAGTRALLMRFGALPLPAVETPIPDEKFRVTDKPKIR